MCAGPLCTRSFRTYAVQASLSIYQYFLSYSTYTMSSIIKWLTPRMHCHNSHTNTEFNTFEYPTKKSGLFIFILFGHLSSISESSFLHFLFPFSLQCLSKVQNLFFQMCNEITLQMYNSSTVSHCINFIQAMEIFNTNNLLPILKIHQYKLTWKIETMALQTGTLMYFEITCTAFLIYIQIF